MGHRTRIMYIENKGDDGIVGPARIGRVTFSKTGKSLNLLRDKENPYPASSEAKQMRQRGCKRQ